MRNNGLSKNLFAACLRLLPTGRKLLWLVACSLALLFLIPGCKSKKVKKLNERITLRRADKNPYGTYTAYENLKHLFPEAVIAVNKQSPAHYNSFAAYHNYYNSDERNNDSKTLYIIITPTFAPGQREMDALMEFVGNGNHI